MHDDMSGKVHWHEPAAGVRAGFGRFEMPMSEYDRFVNYRPLKQAASDRS